jgi:hypothetical protein
VIEKEIYASEIHVLVLVISLDVTKESTQKVSKTEIGKDQSPLFHRLITDPRKDRLYTPARRGHSAQARKLDRFPTGGQFPVGWPW